VRPLVLLLAVALLAPTVFAQPAQQPINHSETIFTGSAAVEANHHIEFPFEVKSADMVRPRVVGKITASGGTGNDIVVSVITEDDLTNMKNGHQVTPIYTSGQVTVANVDARLPAVGKYYVVFSNMFSGVTPKTVSGELVLRWVEIPPPPPPPKAQQTRQSQLPDDKQDGKQGQLPIWQLALLIVLGGVLGGGIVWAIASQKSKRPKS
jgi:hypothetical protein